MNKLSNWIETKAVPAISKITDLRYFQALRNGFLAIMPLTIIGSLFMLITDFPVPGYADFVTGIFGKGWEEYISPAYRATFNIMGFVFAGTMAYKLAESYEFDDKLSPLILSLVAYIVVIPKEVTLKSGEVATKVIPFDWTGTQGVIAAIFMAAITVEVLRFCKKRGIEIKMPDSVPEMVSNAFSALIPGVFIVLIGLLLNGLSHLITDSFPQLLYQIIQQPLQGIVGAPFAIVLVAGLNGLFWWFGIHPTVINSLLYPILYANAESNQKLAAIGNLTAHTGHFGTVQMLDQIATMGGAGATLGLAISLVLVARSQRMKNMSKLTIIPAAFNINEPLIFGLPVVFNPLMLIPIFVAPIAAVLITIVSMQIGFMPMFSAVQVPWATPAIISGFLIAGWQGAVTQLIAVAATVAIYYPFAKLLDRQYVKEEAK
ncbi:PTS sugar transporter subunit IIC [Heyndrickxia coagulans]|uniref:Permease IIC component n=1 Tax=Heyndrickxia coagulans TaxID=1398 RepID=A0A150K4H5_HEYCO|nr:PTS transporter subunit EIIC [Heyndrickxia coagulans]KYC64493.1 PTS system, cellobiose-specific IIC component [Heyndrickxia coagulans]